MSRRMIVMLLVVGILFGGIFAYQIFKSTMTRRYLSSNRQPAVTVSTMKAEYHNWQPQLKAVGSVRAVRGVNVTTEIAGMVERIYFTPGASVEKGTVLVQLKASTDIAQLNALQATADLAQTVYNRDKSLFAIKAISKATLDFDAADLRNKKALVTQQAAIVDKKTIQAPFAGRLGISAVNPGQFINPGDKIVSLQALDPIYVDFFVPQQALVQLKQAQSVTITSDTYPNRTYHGEITTIDPAIDAATRNIAVEATVENSKFDLIPGMFVSVNVHTGSPQKFLTLPQTAVSFNPYGDIIYVVKESGKDKAGKPILIAKQIFVTTGETRGDQIVILKGLQEGDLVVTSGQLKLKNGSVVTINNTVMPANNPMPRTLDE